MAYIVLAPRVDGGHGALGGALVELVQVNNGAVLWSTKLGTVANASTLVFSMPPPFAVRLSKLANRAPSGGYLDGHDINVAEVAGYALGGVSSVLQYAPAVASSESTAAFPPACAVDGWTSGTGSLYMFYHSRGTDTNPWWVATHAAPVTSSIVLTPRQDCCFARMVGVAVELLANYPAPWGGGTGITTFGFQLPASTNTAGQIEIPVSPFSIRVSKFSAAGPYTAAAINLLEIQAYSVASAGGNRLLNTNCLASSTWTGDRLTLAANWR